MFSLSLTPKKMEKLKLERDQFQNAYEEYKTAYENSQAKLITLSEQLSKMEEKMANLTEELNSIKEAKSSASTSQQPQTSNSTSAEVEYNTDEDELEWETKLSKQDLRNQKKEKKEESRLWSAIAAGDAKKRKFSIIETPPKQPKAPLPPPIFLTNVKSFGDLRKKIAEQNVKSAIYKALSDNDLKVTCNNEGDYRAIKKFVNEVQEGKDENSPFYGIRYHTYQLKSERAFRFVIRGLPSSTDKDEIKEEIEKLGHTVDSIVNVSKKITKNGAKSTKTFPLFFVNIRPNIKNKDVYDIKYLLQCKVQIEAPKKSSTIPQCTNCQQLGHTKNFCNREPKCVKCAKDHHYQQCPLPASEKPTCVLCGKEGHPASYKGCETYQKKITAQRNPMTLTQRVKSQKKTIEENKKPQEKPIQTANKEDSIMEMLLKIQTEFQLKFSQLSKRLDNIKPKPTKKKTKTNRK